MPSLPSGLGPPAAGSKTPYEQVADSSTPSRASGYMEFSTLSGTVANRYTVSPGQILEIFGPRTSTEYALGLPHGALYAGGGVYNAISSQRFRIAARMAFNDWKTGLDANQFTGLLLTQIGGSTLFGTDATTQRWGIGLVSGSDNWHSIACDGATLLLTDLGVAAVAGQEYVLTVSIQSNFPADSTVTVGINGTSYPVSILTQNYPEVNYYGWGRGASTSGAADTLYFIGAWEIETEGTI